jgi:hypothetical protein
MKKRNLSPKEKNERVKRERDPIPWRYCLLTLVCGLLLVVGFFWAARQHFSAMDLGIKNARLRQQKEGLEAEARRLYLSKEISLSPNEIKKAAKKIGLQDMTAQSFEIIGPRRSSEKDLDQNSQRAALVKGQNEPLENLTRIAKTSLVEKSAVKTKDSKTKVQILPMTSPRNQIAKK